MTKRLVPISKLEDTLAVPLTKRFPPMEALLMSSKPVSWVEAAVKFQKPVIVSLADLEAGPVTQSRVTVDLEAVYPTLNIPASKEMEEV